VLTVTGSFVAAESVLTHPVAVPAAVVATATATGAGNAVNDYFDREVDAINRPDRPLPRGAVTPQGALVFCGLLFAAAVGAALLLPVAALVIAAVNLLALVAYSGVFKGTPGAGNAVVAYLTGSTFLFGGAAVGRVLHDGAVVLFVLAAVATFTREVIKDVEDVPGDREEGLRTLPIVVGRRPALALGTVAILAAVAASSLPYLRGTFGLAYVLVVVPADIVMLYATAESYRDPGAGQRRLKLGMFVGAAAFVTGRLAELSGLGL
jgi:geranylgeranylglycerol-phosphate geranylgeranyltransferase